MNVSLRRFLLCWIVTLTALTATVVTFNVLVDPYLAFGSPLFRGFNAYKSVAANRQWEYKAYEVTRVAPRTVLLGSSRVARGMDARSPVWPKNLLPVYNLGLDGGCPYASLRYLQHVVSHRAPQTAIIGLDFECFLETPESQHPAPEELEGRLAVNADGTRNTGMRRQYLLDFARFALSYDALIDSVTTVTANAEGDLSNAVLGNTPDSDILDDMREAGAFPWMEWLNIVDVRRYSGIRNRFAMKDIEATLDLCDAHGIRAILYIHPMPADTLEIIDLRGHWEMFEDWKREVQRMVSERYKKGKDIALWDFSDYDAYSTETLRPDGRLLHWFWESWHYRPELGSLIIRRTLGETDIPFGIQLGSGPELEKHLEQVRERRQKYRSGHPQDVARVEAVFAMESRILKSSPRGLALVTREP